MKQRMQPGELSKEGLQKSVNLLLEVDLEALALDQRMQRRAYYAAHLISKVEERLALKQRLQLISGRIGIFLSRLFERHLR